MRRPTGPVLLAALLLLAGCCTPEACRPEALPEGGRSDTAERLFRVLQYAARNDCCDSIYERLSAATREEHGRTKFCLFWEDLELPEPYGYRLADVVCRGELIAVVPAEWSGGREEFLLVEYEAPPRPNLLARVLVVRESDEAGAAVIRLGLHEQLTALDQRGDDRYWWDAH